MNLDELFKVNFNGYSLEDYVWEFSCDVTIRYGRECHFKSKKWGLPLYNR